MWTISRISWILAVFPSLSLSVSLTPVTLCMRVQFEFTYGRMTLYGLYAAVRTLLRGDYYGREVTRLSRDSRSILMPFSISFLVIVKEIFQTSRAARQWIGFIWNTHVVGIMSMYFVAGERGVEKICQLSYFGLYLIFYKLFAAESRNAEAQW